MSASAVPSVPKKKKSKLLLIAAVVVVLAAGGGGAAWWFMKKNAGHAGETAAAAPLRAVATYVALEPAFVVNLSDTDAARYLQADVQVMTRDPDTLKAVEAQAPAIRNRLLLLFGQQSSAQLNRRSGKERLQTAALAEVKKVLKDEGGASKVEAVIFTSLVVQ